MGWCAREYPYRKRDGKARLPAAHPTRCAATGSADTRPGGGAPGHFARRSNMVRSEQIGACRPPCTPRPIRASTQTFAEVGAALDEGRRTAWATSPSSPVSSPDTPVRHLLPAAERWTAVASGDEKVRRRPEWDTAQTNVGRTLARRWCAARVVPIFARERETGPPAGETLQWRLRLRG